MSYGFEIKNANDVVVINQDAFSLNLSDTRTASHLINSTNFVYSDYPVANKYWRSSSAALGPDTSDSTAYKFWNYVFQERLYTYPLYHVGPLYFPDGNGNPTQLSTAYVGQITNLPNMSVLDTDNVNFFYVPVGGKFGYYDTLTFYGSGGGAFYGERVIALMASWKTGIKVKSTRLPQNLDNYGVEVYKSTGELTYSSTDQLGLFKAINSLEVPTPATYPGPYSPASGQWNSYTDVVVGDTGWINFDYIRGGYKNYLYNGGYRPIIYRFRVGVERISSDTMRFTSWGNYNYVSSTYAATAQRNPPIMRYFTASAPAP